MKRIAFLTFFALFVAIFTATEAQAQFLSPEQMAAVSASSFNDVKLGAAGYDQVKRKMLRDPVLEEHVNRLAEKALNVLGWKFDTYTVGVIRDRGINAFALPGGYIFINLGMLQDCAAFGTEAQCLGVLAHELEHTNARHGVSHVKAAIPMMIGNMGMEIATRNMRRSRKVNAIKTAVYLGEAAGMAAYSRKHEGNSDAAAHKVLLATGYSLEAFAAFWDRMERLAPRANPIDGAVGSLFAGHPSPKSRAKKARQAGANQTGGMENSPEWETLRAYVLKKYGAPRENAYR